MTRILLFLAIVSGILSARSGLAAELRYTVRSLPIPVVETCFINDKGQVAGSNGSSGFLHLPVADYGQPAGLLARTVPTRNGVHLGVYGLNNQGMMFGGQYWNKNNVVTEDFNFTPTKMNHGDQLIGQVQGPDWALRLATGQLFRAREFLEILPDTAQGPGTEYQLTDINNTGFMLGERRDYELGRLGFGRDLISFRIVLIPVSAGAALEYLPMSEVNTIYTSLNDQNEATAYTMTDPGRGGGDAQLFLPVPNHGLPAGLRTIYEISSFSSPPPPAIVSNTGVVVAGHTSARLANFFWHNGSTFQIQERVTAGLGSVTVQKIHDLSDTGLVLATGSLNGGPTSLLVFSPVEERDVIVNSTADRGRKVGAECCDTGEVLADGTPECTLRAAIEAVNAGCAGRIQFQIPNAPTPVITLGSALPAVTRPVVIDAGTQTGGVVEINGSALVNAFGLDIAGGESVISGLAFTGFTGDGTTAIRLREIGGNTVAGNFIGTDASGNSARFNNVGILVEGCPDNLIGGATTPEANIMANGASIILRGSGTAGNRILGNRIGIGSNGTYLGGTIGLLLIDSPDNVIGGAASGEGNLVTGESVAIGINERGSNGNRIQGNRIGHAAGQSVQTNRIGIALLGGSDTIIGGPGPLGNRIASDEGGILTGADSLISGLVIEGNEIGLNAAGASANGSIGIFLDGTSDKQVWQAIIRGNLIAGHDADIMLAGAGVDGTLVLDNRVGLAFDGSGSLPAGLDAAERFGIRVDGAPNSRLKDNVVAGHTYDLLVAGGEQYYFFGDGIVLLKPESSQENPPEGEGAAGIVLDSNIVGLNAAGAVPAGATQNHGITIFGGAQAVTVRNNVVAGHAEHEVWLVDGAGHVVAGNHLGSPNGADFGSKTGLRIDDIIGPSIGPDGIAAGNVIGQNSVAGIHLRGAASKVLIRENRIGADSGGNIAWPNRVGILAEPATEGDSTMGLRIEQNVISGNTSEGVSLALPNLVVLQSNRIGLTPNGLPLPNEIGVLLNQTPAELRQNTIAHNTAYGVSILGDQAATIQTGPIYANGNGLGPAGIHYEAGLPMLLGQLGVLRTAANTNGELTVIFAFSAGLPGATGDVEVEIFGNTGEGTQGRVPLARRTVPVNTLQSLRLDADIFAPLARQDAFTLLLTRGGKTGEFTPAVAAQPLPSLPEVKSINLEGDEIRLEWPASDFFFLEQAATISGPWSEVTVPPTVENGVARAVLPAEGTAMFYRLNIKI